MYTRKQHVKNLLKMLWKPFLFCAKMICFVYAAIVISELMREIKIFDTVVVLYLLISLFEIAKLQEEVSFLKGQLKWCERRLDDLEDELVRHEESESGDGK